MRVAVGSGNPVKIDAVKRALGDAGTVVESVPVDSGVSEQPMGESETIRGATNRAERALGAGNYDLGIGIEGGVSSEGPADGSFLTMWAVATDGDVVGRGAGPRLRLPRTVAERVADGEELGPVMDDILGTSGIAEAEGAAGVLTDHLISRESALYHAVAGALGPFVSQHY